MEYIIVLLQILILQYHYSQTHQLFELKQTVFRHRTDFSPVLYPGLIRFFFPLFAAKPTNFRGQQRPETGRGPLVTSMVQMHRSCLEPACRFYLLVDPTPTRHAAVRSFAPEEPRAAHLRLFYPCALGDRCVSVPP